jgi:hypothetical protein
MIADETIGEGLGLENVVLGASLHDMLWRWHHKVGVWVFGIYLHRSRR